MTCRKGRYQPRAASTSQPKDVEDVRLRSRLYAATVAPGAVDLSQASATRAMRP